MLRELLAGKLQNCKTQIPKCKQIAKIKTAKFKTKIKLDSCLRRNDRVVFCHKLLDYVLPGEAISFELLRMTTLFCGGQRHGPTRAGTGIHGQRN
jgi:hypothetical protein